MRPLDVIATSPLDVTTITSKEGPACTLVCARATIVIAAHSAGDHARNPRLYIHQRCPDHHQRCPDRMRGQMAAPSMQTTPAIRGDDADDHDQSIMTNHWRCDHDQSLAVPASYCAPMTNHWRCSSVDPETHRHRPYVYTVNTPTENIPIGNV